jgi:hypothetical protein
MSYFIGGGLGLLLLLLPRRRPRVRRHVPPCQGAWRGRRREARRLPRPVHFP